MVDADWQPLAQHWLTDGTEPDFQPGWARISWNKNFLLYEAVLIGANARNSAQKLNEYTYDLGDVCEIFIEAKDGSHYLELHVTPENQRLQLHWPFDGLAQVRAGQAKLEAFMVADPDWVRTSTHVAPGYWAVQAMIPVEILGLPPSPLTPRTKLATTVCRYDYTARKKPTLSATACFPAPSFHRRADWHSLALLPS